MSDQHAEPQLLDALVGQKWSFDKTWEACWSVPTQILNFPPAYAEVMEA